MTSQNLKSSFPPITSPDIEVLILGSMPGDRSIAENEYYGHPQNRFWKMLAVITHYPPPEDYVAKKQLLFENRIGLWDVAQQAIRKGSMDSDIKNAVPNDIPALISQHPNLKAVGFNGRKAEALFDSHFVRHSDLRYYSLPSTSPANARISFEALCERWQKLFE